MKTLLNFHSFKQFTMIYEIRLPHIELIHEQKVNVVNDF